MSSLSKVLLDHAGNALQGEIALFREEENGLKTPKGGGPAPGSVAANLLETAQWLADEFKKRSEEPTVLPTSQEGFAEQASLLRMFTQMWSIFQLAWRQSRQPDNIMSRAIAAGNKVARGLYDVGQSAELNLVIPHQYLVVVPAGTEGYSVGSDTPTPYIISPYWGLSQVWTWLGFAHEIGHHVYRNVNGLADELKVNVTLELWKNGVDRKHQLLWFNWLEEIFADLFGLLRIGPAFAHTQQIMLDYLPEPVAWLNVDNRLLVADDMTHPMPYLRVFISLCALEKLGTAASDIEPLRKRLETPAGSEPPKKLYALIHGGSQDLDLEEMKKMGETVLDVLLETKLISLAKKSKDKTARSLKEVFFTPSERGKYEMLLSDINNKLKELKPEGESTETIEKLNMRVIDGIMHERQSV